MNILYLIGNGFDLNLKMRTKYKHFYEHYLSHSGDNDSPHIKKLKDTIAKDKENWSDLEYGLGRYLLELEAEEAVVLHSNLIDNLSKYLKSEEDKCIFEEKQRINLCQYLNIPHGGNRLFPTEKTEMDRFYSKWNNQDWNIRIITFNYTRSIERLLGYDDKPVRIGTHNNIPITLSGIEHIHGFTDKRFILGVNDISQIANNKLREDSRVIGRYVKPELNNSYRFGHEKKCQEWIKQAHMICLFGLSFGETDKKWWEIVGEALKREDCRIIIFEFNLNKQFNSNQGKDLVEEEEAIKDRFLEKTTIEDNLKEQIKKNKMYVAYNTDMFRLI